MAGIKFDFTGDNKNLLNSAKQAQTGVTNAIRSIEQAGRGVESTFSQIKGSVLGGFKDIAKGMVGLTALMQGGNFIKELIADAGKFNLAMKEVSTLSEDVAANFQRYKDQVVDMTTEIPIGATEAAKALYQIESAGHHGADGLNVLRESAKGAIGGVTDTATTADAITTILNAYKMNASEAQHVSDLLFTTVRLGKTNMSQLGTTIAQVAPVAASFGVSIEDVLAAIASLTKQGTKTSVAVRQVRDAITATTKSMGDNAFQGRSFLDAMDEVAQKAQGSNNALRQDLGTLQALNAVLSLTGKNSQAARQDVADMQNSAGAAEEAYEKMASTASTQTALLRNNILKAIMPLADEMKSMSGDIAKFMNEAFDSGAMDKAIVSLEAFIATYAVYRGMLAATTAWNSAALGGAYKAQIAQLQQLIPLKELDGQADLKAAVAKGTLTAEQAKLVASLRVETEARYEEIMAAEVAAKAELKALTAAEVSAQANVAAAGEIVAAAQARVAAALESGSASEIEAAKEELNTAERLKNSAVTELNTIQRQKNGAATMVNITEKNADTAAQLMNNASVGAGTKATGLLAAAKLQLKKAIDAVNSSFLASPLFWIAATIAAVTYAVYKLVTAETAHEKALRLANEAMDEQKKKIEDRKSAIDGLIRTIQDPNATDYQKTKAYDQLKVMASDITDAYSKEALATMEAAKAQKILNESMDEAEYEGVKKKVEELTNKLANFQKDLQESIKNSGGGQGAAAVSRAAYAQKAIWEEQLKTFRATLQTMDEIKARVNDESTPIEIRIQEAESNMAEKQRIFDFYDDVKAHVDDIQESHNKLNFTEAQSKLEAYISEVEAELADLHTKAEQNPIDKKIRLKEEEKTNLLNKLLLWKQQMATGGYTIIPLMFKADWGTAQAALNAATGVYQTLSTQTTAGGTQTIAELYKSAKTKYETALKEWKRVSDKKNATVVTPKEYSEAKSGLATAKTDFEAVGGDPDGKQAKAAEQARKKLQSQREKDEEKQEKLFEQKIAERERQAKQMEALNDALSAAAIAKEQNRTKRELLQAEKDHRDKLNAIDREAEEMRKANYEAQKNAWEINNTDKTKSWSGTDTAKAVAEQGYKVIALTEAQEATLKARREEEWAEYAREEKERLKQLISAHQSYADQKLEIEKKYNEEIENYEKEIVKLRSKMAGTSSEEEKKAIQEQINALTRTLGEAAKDKIKDLSRVSMEELQDSPFFSLAWKDLENVSTDTLNMLIDKFKEMEGQFSGDPQAMKEWQERINSLTDEVASRNPFKAMLDARQRLHEANRQKKDALIEIDDINKEIKALEREKKGSGKYWTAEQEEELSKKREKLTKATKKLAKAEQDGADANDDLNKSEATAKELVDVIVGSIKELGDAIGGEAGEILNLVGDIASFTMSVISTINSVTDAAKAAAAGALTAMKAIESASAILAVISVAVQLAQKIASMFGESEEEKQARLKREEMLRNMTSSVEMYRLAVIQARQEEESWFANTNIRKLANQWEMSSEAQKSYFTIARDQTKRMMEDIEHWNYTWADNRRDDPMLWGAVQRLDFYRSYHDAIENLGQDFEMMIKNEEDSLESLSDFIKRVYGTDMFDTNGFLNTGAIDKVLEDYGDRIEHDDEKVLKNLNELAKQYQEWKTALQEFIDDQYGEFSDNLVDALWQWYDEGTDVMDAFKYSSRDTFRSISNEMLKELVNVIVFDELKKKLTDAYTKYSTFISSNEKNEENTKTALEVLTDNLNDALSEFETTASAAIPTLQGLTKRIGEIGENLYGKESDSEEAKDYFDQIRDAWIDTVSAMKGDSEQLGKEIARIMFESLVKSKLFNEDFDTWLQGWTKKYDAALAIEDVAAREQALSDLEKERTAKVNELTDATKELADATHYSIDSMDEFSNSLDNLSDTLLDTLLDAEKNAGQMGAEIGQTLVKEMLKEMLASEKYKERIENIRKMWQAILAGEDKEHTFNDVIADITELSNDMALDEEIIAATEAYNNFSKSLENAKSSFGDLHDDVMSTILDIEHGAENLSKKLNETLIKDLVEKNVFGAAFELNGKEFANFEVYQKDWTDRYLKALEVGDEALMRELVKEMQEREEAMAENAADLAKELQEVAKDTTFTDMEGNFVSALMNMNTSAKDWAESIGKTMAQKIIEQMVVADSIQPLLNDLQEAFNVAMSAEGATYKTVMNDENVQSLLAKIKEEYPGLQELVKGIMEALGVNTGETKEGFGDLRGAFVSSLMDMEGDAESFGKSIGKTMAEQMLDAYIDKAYSEEIKKINDEWADAIASGDPKKIEAVKKKVLELYATIGDDKAVKKLTEDVKKLEQELDNSTPLDNLRSSFLSSLMDMKSSTEDFAKSIGDILTEAFIDKFVLGEEFDKRLEEWKKEYASIMGGNYTEEERENLLKQLKQAIAAAKEGYATGAKAIHELMGTANFSDQEATMNLSDRATYEQADMLLNVNVSQMLIQQQILRAITGGSVTPIDAVQAAPYTSLSEMTSINNTAQQILAAMLSMKNATRADGNGLSEISSKFDTANERLLSIMRSVQSIKESVANNVATSRGILSKL